VFEVITFDLDDTLWDAGPVLHRAEDTQYAWLAERMPRVTEANTVLELQARRRALAKAQPSLAHDFTQLRIAALYELCAIYDYPETLVMPAIEVFLEARSRVEL